MGNDKGHAQHLRERTLRGGKELVPCIMEDTESRVAILTLDENVIGIESSNRKDGNAGGGERFDQGCENAGHGKWEGSLQLQREPVSLGGEVGRHKLFFTHN